LRVVDAEVWGLRVCRAAGAFSGDSHPQHCPDGRRVKPGQFRKLLAAFGVIAVGIETGGTGGKQDDAAFWPQGTAGLSDGVREVVGGGEAEHALMFQGGE